MKVTEVLLCAGGLALATAATYGMAMLGEPSAVWLVCDMLGLC